MRTLIGAFIGLAILVSDIAQAQIAKDSYPKRPVRMIVPFAAGGLLSPLPGELARNAGNADYDSRHNLTATYTYELCCTRRARGWPRW